MNEAGTSRVSRLEAELLFVMALAAVSLSAPAGAAPQVFETAKLVVPRTVDDIVFQELLGDAVAVTEDAAWVGEPIDNVVSSAEGSVFGFQRTADGWNLVNNLTAFDPDAAQQYGHSLAFSDRLAVIGSPGDNRKGYSAGSVYFLERSAGVWDNSQKVYDPSADALVSFGGQVALNGSRALVSAAGDDDAGADKGAAYLFRRSAAGWLLEEKLVPSYPSNWFSASFDVGLDRDVAVLAARTPYDHGLVFVFERTPAGWTQTTVLEDPTPTDDDFFGWSIAVEGDLIVVGEPVRRFFVGPFRPGSTLIFKRTGPAPGNWTFAQEVQASNKSTNTIGGDQFGYDVAIDNGRILVGATYGKVGSDIRGTAYLFEKGPNGWEEIAMLAPSEPIQVDFGNSVSLSSSFALVGARYAEGSVPGIQSGAAYVFELPLGENYCDAAPNSTLRAASVRATGSLAASAGALELWAESLPPHQVGFFLVSRDSGFVPNPGGSQGNLCLGGSIGRFLDSVQSSGADGGLHYVVDTSSLPVSPPSEILPGQTWNFQAWFRDNNPGPTSNFTDGVSITFL